jgi:hypothetical protein
VNAADVIVDFSAYAGKTLTLTNSAKAPFPAGATVDPKGTGMIFQVRVGTTVSGGRDRSLAPRPTTKLRSEPIERPVPNAVGRALTLNENIGPGGPLEVLVNNTMYGMDGHRDAGRGIDRAVGESSTSRPTRTPSTCIWCSTSS